jgi:hypothetical protein
MPIKSGMTRSFKLIPALKLDPPPHGLRRGEDEPASAQLSLRLLLICSHWSWPERTD